MILVGSSHTVGVCGFGRCGSTMVMKMLDAGGLPPVPGSSDRGYELEVFSDLRARQPGRHAIKLLDHFSRGGVPQADSWRFVWIDRDPVEQARSHAKLVAAFGVALSAAQFDLLIASYGRDRPGLLGQLRRSGPVLQLDYERVLVNPRKAAKLLRRWTWPELDIEAAAAVVHERGPKCLPDLAFEQGSGDTRAYL